MITAPAVVVFTQNATVQLPAASVASTLLGISTMFVAAAPPAPLMFKAFPYRPPPTIIAPLPTTVPLSNGPPEPALVITLPLELPPGLSNDRCNNAVDG